MLHIFTIGIGPCIVSRQKYLASWYLGPIDIEFLASNADVKLQHCITMLNSFFKKWANPCLFLFILFFSHDKYSTNLTINDKSIDGMLGTQTRGGRMVGEDESTELWRHPICWIVYSDWVVHIIWPVLSNKSTYYNIAWLHCSNFI